MSTSRSRWTEHSWVLVEGSGPAAREVESQLRELYYEVCTCDGPSDGDPCPLVERGNCSLVDAAEMVVNVLSDDDASSEIVDLIRSSSDATVVRIETQDGVSEIPVGVLVRKMREAGKVGPSSAGSS